MTAALAINSKQWLNSLLHDKFGYEPYDYQLQHGLDLVNGLELVLVVRPGGGKTTIMFAPLLAAQARGESGIAIVVVPTKLLAEQVARVATARGLDALAINEDTVRAASYSKRDLFSDLAAEGSIRVGVMSPQMLRGSRMARFLDSIKKSKSVRWMMVDEAHLAVEDNEGWRVAYATLKFMRARLFSNTIWAAFTGTATPTEALRIARSLAFNPEKYINARYSVDIPHIKYTTRFMAHSHSGNDFYDLAFLIPPTMTSPQDIPRTFVFCETIDLGSRVMAFLDSLIPAVVPRRDQIVKTYNSLMPPDYRQDFIKDIVDGSTLRIGICTDTCTYGLDIPCIRRVVIYGLCADFSTMKQRICRVGRDGLPAIAYTIVPEWVREIPESEITTVQAKEHAARRAKLSEVIRQWHNPTTELCPREVDRRHNEEKPDAPRPDECCSIHKPEPEQSDDFRIINHWVEKFDREQLGRTKKKLRANKDSHRALEPNMIKALARMLTGWRGATWLTLRGSSRDGLAIQFLPTATLNRIAEKAHICTSVERLEQVLEGYLWTYRDQYGQALVDFLAEVMGGFDDIFEARKKAELDSEHAQGSAVVSDVAEAEELTGRSTATAVKPRLRLLLSAKRSLPSEGGDDKKGEVTVVKRHKTERT